MLVAGDRLSGVGDRAGPARGGGARVGSCGGGMVHDIGDASVRGVPGHAKTTVSGGLPRGTAVCVFCPHHGVLKFVRFSCYVGVVCSFIDERI